MPAGQGHDSATSQGNIIYYILQHKACPRRRPDHPSMSIYYQKNKKIMSKVCQLCLGKEGSVSLA